MRFNLAQVELRKEKTFGKPITTTLTCLSTRVSLLLCGTIWCGKSTLLRLIAGLESLTSGEIIIADRPVMDCHLLSAALRWFSNLCALPTLRAFSQYGFSLLQGVAKAEIQEVEVAKILQMEHLLTSSRCAFRWSVSVLQSDARLCAIQMYFYSMNRCQS